MQLGILGLAKAGKTTLFNTLTASRQATDKFSASDKTHVGIAKVPDARLRALRDLFQPRKYTPATVEYVDIPGIKKGEGESLDLAKMKSVDALVHVVRAFEDAEIPHPDGAVDPRRDVETLDLELILADHSLVERRLERLAGAKKRGQNPEEEREQRLLAETILPALERETPLRALDLDVDSERRLRGFQLLSAKPMLIVFNVDEARVATASAATFGVTPGIHVKTVVASAPIEEEISRLEPVEQAAFLADLGLAEPSVDRLIRASYELLGVISFFTVGEDEVRAWTIGRATRAQDAAGAIHTDIARGFIRAEIVPCEELLLRKTLAACREHGSLRLEGKDYLMQDGDVANFRFNV